MHNYWQNEKSKSFHRQAPLNDQSKIETNFSNIYQTHFRKYSDQNTQWQMQEDKWYPISVSQKSRNKIHNPTNKKKKKKPRKTQQKSNTK